MLNTGSLTYRDLVIDSPTPEMYGAVGIRWDRILIVGCHHPLDWGITIDPDPASGARVPWTLQEASRRLRGGFQLIVLDGVSNFVPPSQLPSFWAALRRIRWAAQVRGRCIIGGQRTLRGPVQRWPHPEPPPCVEWIEFWRA
jgi:hypothetical protein